MGVHLSWDLEWDRDSYWGFKFPFKIRTLTTGILLTFQNLDLSGFPIPTVYLIINFSNCCFSRVQIIFLSPGQCTTLLFTLLFPLPNFILYWTLQKIFHVDIIWVPLYATSKAHIKWTYLIFGLRFISVQLGANTVSIWFLGKSGVGFPGTECPQIPLHFDSDLNGKNINWLI